MTEAHEVADSIYQQMTTYEREKFWRGEDFDRRAALLRFMPGQGHGVLNEVADTLVWLIEGRMGEMLFDEFGEFEDEAA